ncbi:MAG: hypothetical protein J0I29_04345 [Rhizobiales bacterium]|nr:hypothetical protein [Hyphomicrobiales bacterium]
MKKALTTFFTVATIAGSLVAAMPAAKAENGNNALAVGAGLLGLGVGAAIASQQPAPVYGGPAYYAPRPRCVWEQQPVWDPYIGANVYRNVKVCY